MNKAVSILKQCNVEHVETVINLAMFNKCCSCNVVAILKQRCTSNVETLQISVFLLLKDDVSFNNILII